MRKTAIYLSTLILAFVLGTSGVWVGFFLRDLLSVNSDLIRPLDLILPKSRFTRSQRACGNGYTQFYITNDGQKVDEGVESFKSARDARKELQRLLSENDVIERGSGSFMPEDGGRYLLVAKTVERKASIVWYDGTDFIKFIHAPNQELALEFDEYLYSVKP
ncbi:MAG: hypothetical protein IPI64_14415 [Chloracidobacterium sp.]|nr:hypothetical protein [Chloracidobacterium sp.]